LFSPLALPHAFCGIGPVLVTHGCKRVLEA
jgi:hypothetical protein